MNVRRLYHEIDRLPRRRVVRRRLRDRLFDYRTGELAVYAVLWGCVALGGWVLATCWASP